MSKEFFKYWLKWLVVMIVAMLVLGPMFLLFGKYINWFAGLINL